MLRNIPMEGVFRNLEQAASQVQLRCNITLAVSDVRPLSTVNLTHALFQAARAGTCPQRAAVSVALVASGSRLRTLRYCAFGTGHVSCRAVAFWLLPRTRPLESAHWQREVTVMCV